MNKFTNILADIIHTACAAEISGDEAIQKQALGDIYDAIASVLPVDHARLARGASPTVSDADATIQPATTRSDGRACRTPVATADSARFARGIPATAEERTGLAKFLTVGDGVSLTRFSGKNETRLVASRRGTCGNDNTIFEIEVDHVGDIARVRRDGKVMFAVFGGTVGHSFIEKLAISALHRYFDTNRKSKEQKKRRRSRIAAAKRSEEIREGILTTDQEIAETVRRQHEEA